MHGQGWLRPVSIVLAAAGILVQTVVPLVPGWPGNEDLPLFPVGDVEARKSAFLAYLRPVVKHRNARIRRERAWLLDVSQQESLGWIGRWRFSQLAERYRVDLESSTFDDALATLERRVDIVPLSLALAQAAKESGWGRSRFARQGNALFGERCFIEGCGMVPRARAPGRTFEVQSFATVGDAVASYLGNLNSHKGYLEFRKARQRLRRAGKPVTGSRLAEYVDSYSVRRDAYVQALKAMIRQNGLETS